MEAHERLVRQLDSAVDASVYDLYELTASEIAIVEEILE